MLALTPVYSTDMAGVPDKDRRQIVDFALKENSRRYIAALIGRPLKRVNRIVQAMVKEKRFGKLVFI